MNKPVLHGILCIGVAASLPAMEYLGGSDPLTLVTAADSRAVASETVAEETRPGKPHRPRLLRGSANGSAADCPDAEA